MKTQVAPRTHTQGSTFSCRKSAPRVGFSISKPPIPFFLLCTPPRCALRCLPCTLCSSLRAHRLSVLLPEQPRRGVDFSEREARRRAAARSDAAPYFLIPRPRSALGAERERPRYGRRTRRDAPSSPQIPLLPFPVWGGAPCPPAHPPVCAWHPGGGSCASTPSSSDEGLKHFGPSRTRTRPRSAFSSSDFLGVGPRNQVFPLAQKTRPQSATEKCGIKKTKI